MAKSTSSVVYVYNNYTSYNTPGQPVKPAPAKSTSVNPAPANLETVITDPANPSPVKLTRSKSAPPRSVSVDKARVYPFVVSSTPSNSAPVDSASGNRESTDPACPDYLPQGTDPDNLGFPLQCAYPNYPSYPLQPTYPSYPLQPNYPVLWTYPGYSNHPVGPNYPIYPNNPFGPIYPIYTNSPVGPTYPGYPGHFVGPSYPGYVSHLLDPNYLINANRRHTNSRTDQKLQPPTPPSTNTSTPEQIHYEEQALKDANAQRVFPASARLFVGNLPFYLSQRSLFFILKRLFRKFGTCYVKVDRHGGPLPTAFVQFEEPNIADSALANLEKETMRIGGRNLRVEKAWRGCN